MKGKFKKGGKIIFLIAILSSSCQIHFQNQKIKSKRGSLYYNSQTTDKDTISNTILDKSIPLKELLVSGSINTAPDFSIFLSSGSNNIFIQGITEFEEDSLTITSILKSKYKPDENRTVKLKLSMSDLETNQIFLRDKSSFDVIYQVENQLESESKVVNFEKVTAFDIGNGQYQLINGILRNQDKVYDFTIINDPYKFTRVIATACIISFKNEWSHECAQIAYDTAQNIKSQCYYQINYENFDWLLLEKDVECEINCGD